MSESTQPTYLREIHAFDAETAVTDAVRRSLGNVPNLPPLVAAAEIELMLRVSRQRVSQLAVDPAFPEPVAVLKVGRIWLREDIEAWAESTGRKTYPIQP